MRGLTFAGKITETHEIHFTCPSLKEPKRLSPWQYSQLAAMHHGDRGV